MILELEVAIARLYAVFSSYTVPAEVDMSPYRDPEKAIGAMRRQPLRKLTASDLDYYASTALTTVGDEHLLRYALPRLLELVTEGDMLTDSEIVMGKLSVGCWHGWPDSEQDAINEFLRSWWLNALENEVWGLFTNAGTVLTSIAQAEQELAWYLARWESAAKTTATDQLAEWTAFLRDEDTGQVQPPAFLSEDSRQWEQLRAWVVRPETLDRLRRGQIGFSRRDYDDEYDSYNRAIQLLRLAISEGKA